MTLRVHFCRKVRPFIVYGITVLCQQSHCLHRESENGFRTLLVKPFHKSLLQPRQSVPVWLGTVREIEIPEQTLKVRFVIVCHVPEHSLIIACACRLVYRVYYLFKTVCYHLVYRTLFQRQVYYLVRLFPIILSILQSEEIVQIHKEFRSGTRSAQHTRHHKHHIDKTSAERFQVCRCRGITAYRHSSARQPWIHCDRSAIVRKACLVILIYKVVRQLVDIVIRHIFSIHLLNPVCQQSSVQTYES